MLHDMVACVVTCMHAHKKVGLIKKTKIQFKNWDTDLNRNSQKRNLKWMKDS